MCDQMTIDLQIKIEQLRGKIDRINALRYMSRIKLIQIHGELAEIQRGDEIARARLVKRITAVQRVEAKRDHVIADLELQELLLKK